MKMNKKQSEFFNAIAVCYLSRQI